MKHPKPIIIYFKAVLGNECDSTAERDSCAAVVLNSQCVVSGTGGVCQCVSGYVNIDSVSCEGMF